MFFASDNAGPALPDVMQALTDANTGYQMPYGNDTHHHGRGPLDPA